MSGPAPAVADVRRAVRGALEEVPTGEPVLVAVSGGADSMALAAAAWFEGRRAGRDVVAVVVDHRLQDGSTSVAQQTATRLHVLGYRQVVVVPVDVTGPGGPEAAARRARYAAIDAVADEVEASVVLLGHTRDDQAESVLLGLARGSGARSLRGMAARTGRYSRPLLAIDRATTRQACLAEGIEVWDDPHNEDPSFARVRVRRAMSTLEEAIGPGITGALARTAEALRDDDAALEDWAAQVRRTAAAGGSGLDVAVLAAAPAGVRRRVLRAAVLESGVPGADVTAAHLNALDALVVGWRGQGPLHLPGGVRALRDCGRLVLAQEHAAQEP